MMAECKIYPPIDEVALRDTPDMSQAPANSMPMPQAAPYPMPQSPSNCGPHVGPLPLGPKPCSVTCPSCGSSIVTSIKVEPNTQTHLIALALCFLCMCFACVPYCVDSCQDANHYCPNCAAFLGTYRR